MTTELEIEAREIASHRALHAVEADKLQALQELAAAAGRAERVVETLEARLEN